jgi:serine protease Do
MKSKSLTYAVGLVLGLLLGCGTLAAQEVRTFETTAVPAPPPGQDGDVMYFFNEADEDDGPEMAFFEAEPEIVVAEGEAELAPPPMHHYAAGRSMMVHGEDRPWLGVMLTDLDSEQAKGTSGVLVKDVREKSPAAQAGMMKDDIITDFAGEKVRSAAQLRRLVRETPVGRSVNIVVSRGGKTQTLTAKLEARHDGPMMGMGTIQAGPEPFTMPLPPPGARGGRNFEYFIQRGARLGISGDDLTTQLAEYFGVKQGKGVLVREVIVGSAAEKAGLKAGDVIVAVDGQEIASVGKLRRALAGDKSGEKPETEKRKITLTIVRDKHEQPLSVELDSPDKGMPKPAMRAEIQVDTERVQEMADEAVSAAKQIGLEWQEHAKTFQSEWQSRMKQEMEKLQKELPKLQNEIEREKKLALAELERI